MRGFHRTVSFYCLVIKESSLIIFREKRLHVMLSAKETLDIRKNLKLFRELIIDKVWRSPRIELLLEKKLLGGTCGETKWKGDVIF